MIHGAGPYDRLRSYPPECTGRFTRMVRQLQKACRFPAGGHATLPLSMTPLDGNDDGLTDILVDENQASI